MTAFFSRYLKSHALSACNHEDEALRALEQFEPDVLLLAQERNYPQLLERVRQLSRAPSLITLPMPSGRAAIRQRGVYDYLVKPVSREMLAKVLATFGGELASIMIIDDNRDIVRLFSQTLRSLDAGYRIRSAYSGAEGLALMREQPPDLLMLDVLMPEMDGFAVIEAMQASADLAAVPIVLISAKGASESITPDIHGDITLKRPGGYAPIELASCVQALIDSLQPRAALKLASARESLSAPT